jgi:hypothetical protein
MPRTCKFVYPLRLAMMLTPMPLAAPLLGQSNDDVPAGFKPDRYQKVWQRNPFALVTPVAPQVQPTLFDKLVLLSWLNDGGNDVVFIQNTETNAVQKVTKEPNADDLKLIEVHADPDPRKAEVVLTNGKEQGIVKFRAENPAAASQFPGSSAAGGAQSPGAAPGVQPLPGTRGQMSGPQNTLQAFQQAVRTGAAPTQQGGTPNQIDTGGRPPRASEVRRKRVTAPPVTGQPVNPQQPSQNRANQPQGQ